jgi:hypothetical protein
MKNKRTLSLHGLASFEKKCGSRKLGVFANAAGKKVRPLMKMLNDEVNW